MEVPLMHTQENRFVINVAPEGSLQGFQIRYIEDLINLEPCTLRGKPLFEERNECAFPEPQIRACKGQQPGTLSSERTLQPLPTVGLEEITASAGEIRDEGVSPPTLPLRHQRCFDFHHDAIDQVAKTWQYMEGWWWKETLLQHRMTNLVDETQFSDV